MYATTDVCHLEQGYYNLKVNNVPVTVDPVNRVVANQYAKPACFFLAKGQSGDVCTYNIYLDSKFAEFNSQWGIYMQPFDSSHEQPRYWTITWLKGDTYTIAPGPPSANGWTAPDKGGQVYLTTLLAPPTVEQEFVFTPC